MEQFCWQEFFCYQQCWNAERGAGDKNDLFDHDCLTFEVVSEDVKASEVLGA